MPGDRKNVGDKWEDLYAELKNNLPYSATFGDMKNSAMKTQLEKMVSSTSSEGTKAQRESGGGTHGSEEEEEEESGSEDGEKKVTRDLVSEQGALKRFV